MTCAIAAHRHCGRVVVTASVNNVAFNQPIKLGEIVVLHAKVSRAFTSSMEVFIDVWVENNTTGERKKCNEIENTHEKALAYCHKIKGTYFDLIRYHVDKLEYLVGDEFWPLPKYRELLFIK